MNYRKLYETGKDRLEKAGIQEAALDARLLLEEVCRTDRNTLLVHGDRAVTEEEETQFRIFIETHMSHCSRLQAGRSLWDCVFLLRRMYWCQDRIQKLL